MPSSALYVVASALHHGFESHSLRHVFNNLAAIFTCHSLLSWAEPCAQPCVRLRHFIGDHIAVDIQGSANILKPHMSFCWTAIGVPAASSHARVSHRMSGQLPIPTASATFWKLSTLPDTTTTVFPAARGGTTKAGFKAFQFLDHSSLYLSWPYNALGVFAILTSRFNWPTCGLIDVACFEQPPMTDHSTTMLSRDG